MKMQLLSSLKKWYKKDMDFLTIYIITGYEALAGVNRCFHLYPRWLKVIHYLVRMPLIIGYYIVIGYQGTSAPLITLFGLMLKDIISISLAIIYSKEYIKLVKSLRHLRDDITSYKIQRSDQMFGIVLHILYFIIFNVTWFRFDHKGFSIFEWIAYMSYLRLVFEMHQLLHIIFVFRNIIKAHETILVDLCCKVQSPLYNHNQIYKEFVMLYRWYLRLEDCSFLSSKAFTINMKVDVIFIVGSILQSLREICTSSELTSSAWDTVTLNIIALTFTFIIFAQAERAHNATCELQRASIALYIELDNECSTKVACKRFMNLICANPLQLIASDHFRASTITAILGFLLSATTIMLQFLGLRL